MFLNCGMLSPRLSGNETRRYLASASAPDQKLAGFELVPDSRRFLVSTALTSELAKRATRSSETHVKAFFLKASTH